jgi:hypothetical protein
MLKVLEPATEAVLAEMERATATDAYTEVKTVYYATEAR